MTYLEQPAFQRLQSIISERTNRIVLWIGAGFSMPAGLPSWQQLRTILCDALDNKSQSMDETDKAYLQQRASQIRTMQDNWLSFQMLESALGRTSYRSAVRDALSEADRCSIPMIYSLALDLPVTGILTLNLDRIATRAFTSKYPGRQLIEFEGSESGKHSHVLKGSSPFIVNLHGVLQNEESWVFTRDELRTLLRHDGYKMFVRSCLLTRTVIFMGISADDVAAGGHLEALTDDEVDLGNHFWITDRTDAATDYWAEHSQLEVLRYKSEGGDHSQFNEIVKSLIKHKPEEEEPDPVTMIHAERTTELPSVNELQKESDPETIRQILNAYAAEILEPDPETKNIDYAVYEYFCEEYDELMYRAWYVTTNHPRNKLLGYTIEEEVADGAFGRVYKAKDNKGRAVAVKILREEVRRKPEMLQSFRRGVRSMRILANRNVQGMVPYEEASEIPAFAAMEFVEGPNLHVTNCNHPAFEPQSSRFLDHIN